MDLSLADEVFHHWAHEKLAEMGHEFSLHPIAYSSILNSRAAPNRHMRVVVKDDNNVVDWKALNLLLEVLAKDSEVLQIVFFTWSSA